MKTKAKILKKLISIGLLSILLCCAVVGCAVEKPPVGSMPPTDSTPTIPPNENLPTAPPDENVPNTPSEIPPSDILPSKPTKPSVSLQPLLPAKEYDILVKSTTNSLNVRAGAGSKFGVMGAINAGDMLDYVSTEGDWHKVRYKRGYGYVSRRYTTLERIEKSDRRVVEDILHIGKGLMGYPYVWGAQRYHWGNGKLNPNFVQGKYDCSSLVQYMFYIGGGVVLDVNTRTQVLQGKQVPKSELRRGDVIFFTNAERKNLSGVERVGHVAVYLGNNYILHTASDYAVIEPISSTRWSHYIVAKRMI